MMHFRGVCRSIAISIFLTIPAATALASNPSNTATCDGWSAQGPWQSAAYAIATVSLVQCSAPAAPGTPCTGTIIEVDQATSCLAAAGTMNFSGTWQHRPLNGFYQAWFNITVYS